MAISNWSTTASSNTSVDGINIAEGCPPSNVNDAMRAIMANVAGGDFGDKPIDVDVLTVNTTFTAPAASITAAMLAGGAVPFSNGFRLTLTSNTPVTTTDVTGAGTIYLTPHKGNVLFLYVSGAWVRRTTAQVSIALSGLTSGRPYDVFAYDNAGTVTLEVLAWTNDTTRATALAYQDGILTKSGDPTRLYLGSFYTTSTTATEDSAANRYLWNYYNRVASFMERKESTASWTYSTATWRQANGSTANQVNFIVGLAEDAFNAVVSGVVRNSGANANASVAVGYDSITVPSGIYTSTDSSLTAAGLPATGHFSNIPAAGRHYFSWLEVTRAIATGSFDGVNTGTVKFLQSGMYAGGMR